MDDVVESGRNLKKKLLFVFTQNTVILKILVNIKKFNKIPEAVGTECWIMDTELSVSSVVIFTLGFCVYLKCLEWWKKVQAFSWQ